MALKRWLMQLHKEWLLPLDHYVVEGIISEQIAGTVDKQWSILCYAGKVDAHTSITVQFKPCVNGTTSVVKKSSEIVLVFSWRLMYRSRRGWTAAGCLYAWLICEQKIVKHRWCWSMINKLIITLTWLMRRWVVDLGTGCHERLTPWPLACPNWPVHSQCMWCSEWLYTSLSCRHAELERLEPGPLCWPSCWRRQGAAGTAGSASIQILLTSW